MDYIGAAVGVFGVVAMLAGWIYTSGRDKQKLGEVVEDVNALRMDLVELRAVTHALDPNLSPRVGRAEVAIGRIETMAKNTEAQLGRLDMHQTTVTNRLDSVNSVLHQMVGVLMDRGQMRTPPAAPG